MDFPVNSMRADNTDTPWYDVELIRIEEGAQRLTFRVAGSERVVCSANAGWWEIGTIGRLMLGNNGSEFGFHAYADQRLRRAPERDDPARCRWGWRMGEHRFCVKTGIVPGRSGAVVREDTTPTLLDLPREFVDRCTAVSVAPDAVLRTFIADLCDLRSSGNRPREDGYCASGQDEGFLAREYFQRTFECCSAALAPDGSAVGDPIDPTTQAVEPEMLGVVDDESSEAVLPSSAPPNSIQTEPVTDSRSMLSGAVVEADCTVTHSVADSCATGG